MFGSVSTLGILGQDLSIIRNGQRLYQGLSYQVSTGKKFRELKDYQANAPRIIDLNKEIEARTARSVSRGAVYVTLDRLEKKGFLSSRLGAPTPERGGKAKRIFSLEAEGRAALRVSLEEIRGMLKGTDEGALLGWST